MKSKKHAATESPDTVTLASEVSEGLRGSGEEIIPQYEFHEVANVFPLMEGEDFDQLVEDIRANGLREAIILHEGRIIDGRNRYRACLAAEVEPCFVTWIEEGSVIDYIVSLNLHRRHLTPSQRAVVALDLLPLYEEEARQRQLDLAGTRPNTGFDREIDDLREIIPEGRARDKVAGKIGANPHYVSDIKSIAAKSPELIDQIRQGQMSIPEAMREIAKAKREEKIEGIATGRIVLPEGKFEIIAIDPPWPYGTDYDPEGRRAASPYPEMSLEDIAALKLPAAEDSVLWFWTTHRFMRHSFAILDIWGFRDVAILTWRKDRMGLGSWLRSQSEFCIMAVKGKPPVKLTNQTTVIEGALREHSRKPDSFYELVEGLCVGRKLDYFSREAREGWSQVGNEPDRFPNL